MAPIRISRDQAVDLIDGNHFPLDEIAMFICDGQVSPIFENLENTYFDVGQEITQKIPEMFETWNVPSLLLVQEDSSICSSSLTVASCNDWFSLPLFDIEVATRELESFLSDVPELGDDSYPDEQSEQDELWAAACLNMKRRALGLLSSYLARTPDGISPAWYVSDLARIVDDNIEYLHVAITGPGADGLCAINCWDEFWNGLEDHDGPVYRTTWKPGSQIQVVNRDQTGDLVLFKLVDEDGHETFQAQTQNFDGVKNFLLNNGWSFTETTQNSATIVGANNNFGNVFGAVNSNSIQERIHALSPTPHIQPTQQRPGAAVDSGIISANVNITGLAQLNGIVQGDVTVPAGSDVNLNGIVQGTVWVNGGTARLFGTISAAAISSGRIEIYGILQSPLQYNGGDVYFHPNSIVG
jgi:hypothetical protein